MGRREQMAHVMMVRRELADIPRFPVPEPFGLRFYRAGDEKHWTRIEQEADRYNTIAADRFEREFGRDEEDLKRRQFFLCDGQGVPIGTATAWHNAHFPDKNWGRVHWVAIVPGMRGRGLARPLLSACLNRMVELGCDSSYLTTESPRIPAITLYLKFGFRPHLGTDDDVAAWRAIREHVREEDRELVVLT